MTSGEIRIKTIAYLENPQEFLKETENVISLLYSQFDFSRIRQVFADIKRLFRGKYPGYGRCAIP
jgi:hypothetical protein